MNPPRLSAPFAAALAVAFLAPVCGASPRRTVPSSDTVVVATLPRIPGLRPAAESGRAPGPSVSDTSPEIVAREFETLRAWILRARQEADPRWLTRAQARHQALSAELRESPEGWFLEAEILQGLHQFRPALARLDRVLQGDPRHAGAWQLKASLHQLLGEYPAARAAVLQLARWGSELNTATSAAALAGLTTGPIQTAETLLQVLRRQEGAPSELLAWGWTTAGEIQALHGHTREAETSFREALRLDPAASYTRGAFADLLLDSGRAAEVVELLHGAGADTLRIRLAEAFSALPARSTDQEALTSEILEGFELSRLRGDDLHLREQARFTLRVLRQPRAALPLATANAQIQREPADLLLWLEAADAAGDTNALAQAESWTRTHQPVTWQHFLQRTRPAAAVLSADTSLDRHP